MRYVRRLPPSVPPPGSHHRLPMDSPRPERIRSPDRDTNRVVRWRMSLETAPWLRGDARLPRCRYGVGRGWLGTVGRSGPTWCSGAGRSSTAPAAPGVGPTWRSEGDRIVAVGDVRGRAGGPQSSTPRAWSSPRGSSTCTPTATGRSSSPETAANLNYLTQGVTTVVTGNCGCGPVDVAEYFAKIDAQGVGTNVIHLVPHSSVAQPGHGQRQPQADRRRAEEDGGAWSSRA